MHTRLITLAAGLGLGLGLALAACGGDDTGQVAAPAAIADGAGGQGAPAAPAQSPGAPATVDVLAGETDLGPSLVGPDGKTLYGFTNDIDAISTCYGTCADAWPPVIVTDEWTAGPGLDFGIFATTVREDGQRQLVAGRWPLYYFAGDAGPGDLNGQASGNVWFAVDLGGALIQDTAGQGRATGAATDGDGGSTGGAGAASGSAAPGYGEAAPNDEEAMAMAAPAAPVLAGETALGPVLVDQDGRTLYGFLDDRGAAGSTCNGACAEAWPPVIVDGGELPAGLDSEVFSVITRDDGSNQLAAGIWPLYRFAGDGGPGDTNGQGSGGVWFAAAPDGGLVGAP